ncbi:MAG TPA: YsnF/AvaK domain-containing protein, partial [Longimicrobium sp.]|nr:YsnF/AvaK domain-containing protein [Longimicrobium sp.]
DVSKRQVSAGEVGVHRRVETEHVREEVPLRHEEVVVERRPVTDAMAAGRGEIIETDDEIRIPLMAEEAVVEKRVVPKEELVVRKREVVETEHVDTTLRSEHAEVDREVTNPEVRGDRMDDDGRLDRR